MQRSQLLSEPGFAIGMTSLEKMVNSPAPSILAASEISWGIPVKNWQQQKDEERISKKAGNRKRKEGSDPLLFVNIRNRGTSVT